MSATNRNGKPKTPKQERCQTPPWAIEVVLPVLGIKPPRTVLDPCCGHGNILLAAKEWGAKRVIGMEIYRRSAVIARQRAPFAEVFRRDSLSRNPWPEGIDLVLTNPPYSKAEAFVLRSIMEVGDVPIAMLLRIGFAACKCRRDLFREHPADIEVLERRPIFWGRGGDASEYAWFIWGPGRGGRWARLACPARDGRYDPRMTTDAALRALLEAESKYLRSRGYTSRLVDGALWWLPPLSTAPLYGSPGMTQRRAVQVEREKDSARLRLESRGL